MQYNIPNMAGSNLRVGFFWAEDPNRYALGMPVSGRINPTTDSIGTVEWSVAASYNHRFNAQWSATIGGQYFEEFGGADAWLAQAAVVWAPVTNFEVRLEGSYADEDFAGDATSGFLRFTRYF
jgi:hypothetical protein